MKDKILKAEYIYLDLDIATQDQAFEFIASKALELGITNDQVALIKGFKDREAESSTGFEDGFAIPHARIKEVKQAAVFVLRFKKALDWSSMDGKPTKVALALLIPEGPSGDEHLEILSDIAVKLMDESFKKTLKESSSVPKVLKVLEANKTKEVVEVVETKDSFNIIAITACVVGVAHTYMAEEKLLQGGKSLGYNTRVETHGSKGIGTPFTNEEIEKADLVIFATDTKVDDSRFAGKKIFKTKVAQAIKDPQGIINKAIAEGYILEKNKANFNTKARPDERVSPLQHILSGIGYMIPVIILGGICLAFSLGLAKAVWGAGSGTAGPDGDKTWNILNVLQIIGGAAFALMIPILAGFIANSIAGRAAIAPAMVSAFIGNSAGSLKADGSVDSLGNLMPWIHGMNVVQTPLGFIGAIIAGLCIGYAVKWINTWKVPRSLRPAMPIFFIPLVTGIIMSLIFIYVIGAPIGWVMERVQVAIKHAYSGTVGIGVGIGLGLILGAMGGFDMGGPVNKMAFITCSMLVTQEIYQPMGSLAAAIPVAPLSMGLSTILCKKFFTKEEQGLGIAAMIMGCIGISEGAIPFAIRDPKRAIICNVIGSAVAGAIAGAFGIQNYAAHGGPIVAILGAIPYGVQTLYFFIAIIAGVAITTSTYCLWMMYDAGATGSVKEAHNLYVVDLKKTTKAQISTIKAQIKGNKDQSEVDSLKAQIKALNEQLKANINQAELVLKDLIGQEKEFVKSKTFDTKAFKNQNKLDYHEKLQVTKADIKAIVDKEARQEAKEAIYQIKDDEIKSYENYQIELKQDFVTKYKQAVAK